MTNEQIAELLWKLPHSERMAMLVISILKDQGNNPTVAATSLVKTTQVISQYLSTTNRFRVADAFRNAADELERKQQVYVTS